MLDLREKMEVEDKRDVDKPSMPFDSSMIYLC